MISKFAKFKFKENVNFKNIIERIKMKNIYLNFLFI